MNGTLLFGIGNCGRGDDGLGWAFLDRLKRVSGGNSAQLEYRYQLNVEDAAMIRRAERVIFIDACRGFLPGGFQWTDCAPAADFEFTSHVLAPSSVLHICLELYGRAPPAELLLIQGECWDLGARMSGAAHRRLDDALKSFSLHPLGEPCSVH